MITMEQAISKGPYPGRGILMGKSPDGTHAVIAYFIMGRSENSRNRVFVRDGEGIRTQAHDPKKLTDPSLIIYAPVRKMGKQTIVTNGDQTDTICEHIAAGGSFASALRTRTFEPDAPNFTPRISAIATFEQDAFSFTMSLLKSAEGNPTACLRHFYEYETPLPGQARFLHTYRGDGNPLPSFEGEPEAVTLPEGDANALAKCIWNALDTDNRVSLFVRTVRLSDGHSEDAIINQLA